MIAPSLVRSHAFSASAICENLMISRNFERLGTRSHVSNVDDVIGTSRLDNCNCTKLASYTRRRLRIERRIFRKEQRMSCEMIIMKIIITIMYQLFVFFMCFTFSNSDLVYRYVFTNLISLNLLYIYVQ